MTRLEFEDGTVVAGYFVADNQGGGCYLARTILKDPSASYHVNQALNLDTDLEEDGDWVELYVNVNSATDKLHVLCESTGLQPPAWMACNGAGTWDFYSSLMGSDLDMSTYLDTDIVIKITFDFTNKTYDVDVNGTSVATDIGFNNAAAVKVEWVRVYTGAIAGAGTTDGQSVDARIYKIRTGDVNGDMYDEGIFDYQFAYEISNYLTDNWWSELHGDVTFNDDPTIGDVNVVLTKQDHPSDYHVRHAVVTIIMEHLEVTAIEHLLQLLRDCTLYKTIVPKIINSWPVGQSYYTQLEVLI